VVTKVFDQDTQRHGLRYRKFYKNLDGETLKFQGFGGSMVDFFDDEEIAEGEKLGVYYISKDTE
jgi:hypothetical protein